MFQIDVIDNFFNEELHDKIYHIYENLNGLIVEVV